MRRCGWRLLGLAGAAIMLAAAAPPAPSLPPGLPPVPQAAATLDQPEVPAAAEAETLLHVTSPGRFAIAAKSPAGAALELVDMISGPTPRAGVAGAQDGRLDLLLDVGIYKLRVFSAPDAAGTVALSVVPSTEAAPPAAVPDQGRIDATLTEDRQRSFWIAVRQGETLRLEAAGRSLADFRLWRDGRDLVPLRPETTVIEPVPGHPLTDMVLTGAPPPGTYRVTAYGGRPLAWADADAAQPLHLRGNPSRALLAGWVAGHVGPFGNAVFQAAPGDDVFQLDITGPATLRADGRQAAIAANSRAPSVRVYAPVRPGTRFVQVTAQQGRAYQLRGMALGGGVTVDRPGSYWITANTTGYGGDAPPATLLLARFSADGFAVLGADAPAIGPAAAWRRKFNLTGRTTLIFHATAAGQVAAVLAGMDAVACDLLDAGSGRVVPPVVGKPGLWDLNEGWYALRLTPPAGKSGIADVTIGPPGLSVPLGPSQPAGASLSFGRIAVTRGERLALFGNIAPGAFFGLAARPLPVALDVAPFRFSQKAGEILDIPVAFPAGGRLVAVVPGAGPIAAPLIDGRVHLAAPSRARSVGLAWLPDIAPLAIAPSGPEERPILSPGTPVFFDLGRNRQRSFALQIADGGLYRVETLGRMHIAGGLGTHFLPQLETADGNGRGDNMALTGWLRAGAYHVDVSAIGSSGHLGLLAAPEAVLQGTALMPGSVARMRIPADEGAVFPLQISRNGTYKLDLLGLNRVFTARLEDSQGWPLQTATRFASLTRVLAAGTYRLLVLPQPTDARAVVRLAEVVRPAPLAGHGPHPLPFDATQHLTWREPAARADPRQPDQWDFSLAAPADIRLDIGEGMQAVLSRGDAEIGRFNGSAAFTGRLPAGAYRVAAMAQGRNDRLDYTLRLAATQLQPGVPRRVTLPASLPFALAQDRVVSLTSFGDAAVRAVLRDAAGRVVGRFGDRDADWNIAASRFLPAGAYRLDLSSAAPPASLDVPHNPNDFPADLPDGADPREAQRSTLPAGDDPDADATDDQAAPHARPVPTQVTLALLADRPPQPAPDGVAQLSGGGVHRLLLRRAAPGDLLLATARAATETVLSLERQNRAGAWHSIATDQGFSPLIAVPADGAAWRISVWPVDGGGLPIRLGAKVLHMPATPGAAPDFVASQLPDGPFVAHLALASHDVLAISARHLLAGVRPGHAATAPQGGTIAPQADDLWLIARAKPPTVTVTPAAPGAPAALLLADGTTATLPGQPGASGAPIWIATSAAGQPGLEAGHGMGVAAEGAGGSAFALAGPAPLRIRNAGAAGDLRVTLQPQTLALADARAAGENFSTMLAPGSALPLSLPEGTQSIHVDLAPGTAAVAGWLGSAAVTAWAGEAAISRRLVGPWRRVLLVNTGRAAAPVTLRSAGAVPETLTPNHALRRFFGSAGSRDFFLHAAPGQTLHVAGNARAVFLGDDGTVSRGTRLALAGPGRLILDHGTGLVAAWLDGEGAAPWPAPSPTPAAVPGTTSLAGAAMALALAPATPILLHAGSDAPVILALGAEPPRLFPAGAALNRYLPAGPAILHVIAPQDAGLAGRITLTATPVRPAPEGLGPALALAPGRAALFGFTLAHATRIGVGIRAEPDVATARLLDAAGNPVASGVAMLRTLPAGAWLLEVRVPPDAPTTLVRTAVVGTVPRPNGPPPDVVQRYRELAGLVPQGGGQ